MKMCVNSDADDDLNNFGRAMDMAESISDCNCEPDCQKVDFKIQVNTEPLDYETLCSADSTGKIAIETWRKQNSPLTYWAHRIEDNHIDLKYVEGQGSPMFHNGVEQAYAKDLCKDIYKNNIAKLVLKIGSPSATKIQRDVSITFAEQLGVFGKISVTDH